MYMRPSTVARDAAHVREILERYSFGVMVGGSGDGLFATHLPFLYDADRGEHGTLVAHLARANAHVQQLERGEPQLVIFSGPHGYVSPSWYVRRDTAPTWNYIAVHCYGVPVITPEPLRAIQRLVDVAEANRPNPWRVAELSEAERQRLLARVVAFEIPLTRIEAKFKLSQGELPENTAAAIEVLDREGDPELVRWMREYAR
ncbi:MAG TPA: FMN-binding negative transcriptional regulator [Thermoanaerobaculia bacterium]|jgi:transcriptional regulator